MIHGLGDDSFGSYRLHIFGRPDDSGGGFSLVAVEETICGNQGSAAKRASVRAAGYRPVCQVEDLCHLLGLL